MAAEGGAVVMPASAYCGERPETFGSWLLLRAPDTSRLSVSVGVSG